jgi:alkaline phosphatase D
VHTRASFVVEDRVPGLHQTYDRPIDPAVSALRAEDAAAATVRQETERP